MKKRNCEDATAKEQSGEGEAMLHSLLHHIFALCQLCNFAVVSWQPRSFAIVSSPLRHRVFAPSRSGRISDGANLALTEHHIHVYLST